MSQLVWNKEQGKLFQNKCQTEVSLENIVSWCWAQAEVVYFGPTFLILSQSSEDWLSMLKNRVFWFPQLHNCKGCFLFYFLFFPPISRGHRDGVFNHSLQYRMQTPVESWSFLSPKMSLEFVLFLAGSISQSKLQLSGQDFKSNFWIAF